MTKQVRAAKAPVRVACFIGTLGLLLAGPRTAAAVVLVEDPVVEVAIVAQAEVQTANADAEESSREAKAEQARAERDADKKQIKTPQDEAAIDDAKKDASDKQEIAMAAATTSMNIAIIQGILQTGAAAVSLTAADCDAEGGTVMAHALAAHEAAVLTLALAAGSVTRLKSELKELPPSSSNAARRKQLRERLTRAKRSAAIHKKAAKKVQELKQEVVTLCS